MGSPLSRHPTIACPLARLLAQGASLALVHPCTPLLLYMAPRPRTNPRLSNAYFCFHTIARHLAGELPPHYMQRWPEHWPERPPRAPTASTSAVRSTTRAARWQCTTPRTLTGL